MQGALLGIPKVKLYHSFLAYETGDAFMHHFYQAADGHLEPFCLVIEGSIPNEAIKDEGY